MSTGKIGMMLHTNEEYVFERNAYVKCLVQSFVLNIHVYSINWPINVQCYIIWEGIIPIVAETFVNTKLLS